MQVGKEDPTVCSKNLSALNEANQQDDNGNYQQDVNKATHGGTCDESEQPEDDQNDGDGV